MRNGIDPILGAIIGDISGSFREFSKDKFPGYPTFPTKKQLPIDLAVDHKKRYGVTDDSVLTFATMRTLVERKEQCLDSTADEFSKQYYEYGTKYRDPVGGYGGGFKLWLLDEDVRKPYHSCGNGSAMRISPVGAITNSVDECVDLAFQSAICTHNHPDGIKGAQAVAIAIHLGMKGYDYPSISNRLKAMHLWYDPVEQYDHFDSICQETCALANYILLTTTDFESALHTAVTKPHADSDTLGAIVGSIAAAMYGIPTDMIHQLESGDYMPKEFRKELIEFNEEFFTE